jgi:hypothetical protein
MQKPHKQILLEFFRRGETRTGNLKIARVDQQRSLQSVQKQDLPHNNYYHLDGARVEIIPCKPKLPAITVRDPV